MNMCLKPKVQFYRFLIILEIIGLSSSSADNDAYGVFADLANEHYWNCEAEIFAPPMPGGNPNECCGFCNNEQNCKNSGTCCLGFYSDFEEALSSKPINT